jgi:hypothetical protein
MPVRASKSVALRQIMPQERTTCLRRLPKAVHYSIESERGFIDGGSDFVTARERSEKAITLKALPQVVFSRTGYIYIPFGGKFATFVTASRFYTETNCIVVESAFRLPRND